MRYMIVQSGPDLKQKNVLSWFDCLKEAQTYVVAEKYKHPQSRYFIYHCTYEVCLDKPTYSYRPLDEPSPEIG